MKDYSAMTFEEISEVPLDELQQASKYYHKLKAWCTNQIVIDKEISRRGVMEWRNQDVFGKMYGFDS